MATTSAIPTPGPRFRVLGTSTLHRLVGQFTSCYASPVYYLTVQPGFEKALEAELFAHDPGARIVEALPGWRVTEAGALPELIFAKSSGRYLGRAEAGALPDSLNPVRELHCWARRADRPGKREKMPLPREVSLHEPGLRKSLGARGLLQAEASDVLDAIRLNPGVWAWGSHRPAKGRIPFPGAEFPWPEREIPSRAYLKLKEMLLWAEVAPKANEVAIELGCAPGGALLALLEFGCVTWGVDPAPLSPEVASRVTHLQNWAEKVDARQLPKRVDWLFSDMNQPPRSVLALLETWLPALQTRGIQGIFVTLKLSDPLFIHALGELRGRVFRGWGAKKVLLKQLSQNRRELTLFVSWV